MIPSKSFRAALLGLFLTHAFSDVRAAREVSLEVAEDARTRSALQVLDAWIESTSEQRGQPGISIGVVFDQALNWSKGYGYADLATRVPASEATLYRIASISKLFTSTAILQLRDQGRLSLDDPVEKHLPWFVIRPSKNGPGVVRVRHLLTHTAGLPREATDVHWIELTFPEREELIRNLGNQIQPFPPATEWKYSNLGLSLVGEMVRAVSGVPWENYVKNHVFDPLDMRLSTTVPRPDEPGLAAGYGPRMADGRREERPYADLAAERPAGNIASCVRDLAKFVSLQLLEEDAENPVLRRSSLQQMHRVHWLLPDWKTGWGLGFRIRRVGEETRIGHGGSLPGYRSDLEFSPARKLGVIVLTNAADGNPGLYRDAAFEILGPAIDQVLASFRKTSGPEPGWNRYVGDYRSPFGNVRVLNLGEGLTLIDPEADDPWESRVNLEPVSEHTFRAFPRQWHYILNGEELRFELNKEQEVVRLAFRYYYWIRK